MTGARDTQVAAARPAAQTGPRPFEDRGEMGHQTATGPVAGGVTGRVLLVGDEPIIAESVLVSLRFAGYETHLACTGAQAVSAGEQLRPHLIVLDTRLPDIDGFALARQLRHRHQRTPILFLTAPTDLPTRGMGLTVGADDYLTKPFSLDELAARVRAALRRAHSNRARHTDAAILRFADLEFNEDTHQVRRAAHPIQLTPREREILRYLLVNAGRIVTRAHIHEHVWPYDYTGYARVLDVHICTLRRKIHRHGPPLIHTLHGLGYILRHPDNHASQHGHATHPYP